MTDRTIEHPNVTALTMVLSGLTQAKLRDAILNAGAVGHKHFVEMIHPIPEEGDEEKINALAQALDLIFNGQTVNREGVYLLAAQAKTLKHEESLSGRFDRLFDSSCSWIK